MRAVTLGDAVVGSCWLWHLSRCARAIIMRGRDLCSAAHLVKKQAQGGSAACGVGYGRVPRQQPAVVQRCQLAQGEGALHTKKLSDCRSLPG